MIAWLWRVFPRFLSTALPAALCAILCAALSAVLWTQRQTIRAQQAQIAGYGERLRAQDAALGQMRADIEQAAHNQRALAAMQEGVRAALTQRQTDIRELKRENQEFRLWADGLLPDAVARMRERPGITGAGDYACYLRERQPLHAGPRQSHPQ